jgi:hypothetical protein
MWAMADIDGRDLARDFYASVFSGGAARGYHITRELQRHFETS